ncbi:helix-loop-helix DNA-binding domain-containing protein [Sporodiniella umbellata]|nr:helix-loop-helix DNA-binding domain-containing protein [Sporodiniella umbellata]
MPQQYSMQPQDLRLRNPTSYHLMATGQLPASHPLSNNKGKSSPGSETMDFQDTFAMNPFSPQEESLDFPMYQRSDSYGTLSSFPMNIRRSSHVTDSSHGPTEAMFNNSAMFMASSSLDSAQSLAMSAPTNVGYYPVPVPSLSNNSIAKSFEEDYTTQMNMQVMMDKRRRRRESHNAVERRRRDNINDRIQELCTLLPESSLDGATVGQQQQQQQQQNKLNKGVILKKSVEHVRFLQQQVRDYQQKIQELENTLHGFHSQ